MKRARTNESKEARKSSILAAAQKIIDSGGFSSLTIESVTKRCGLAKGTFYLYFPTREDVILEVLKEDFESWFQGFERHLGTVKQPFGPGLLAFWQKSLEERPRLVAGFGYLHSALEPDMGEEFLFGFKVFLLQRLKAAHYLLIQAFEPYVSLEDLAHFFMVLTGISVGLWTQSMSSVAAKKVFEKHPELRLFQGDFAFHFQLAAGALLEAPHFRGLRQLRAR